MEPRKNVGALLDAYEHLLSTDAGVIPSLVLAGQATAESKPWLDRLSRAPLEGHVRHIGYVEPGDRKRVHERAIARFGAARTPRETGDEIVKPLAVIPAKAGTHLRMSRLGQWGEMGSRLRGNDEDYE